MSRDYKSRAHPQSAPTQQSPAWIWFFSGLLVGLFAAGLAWLKLELPAKGTATTQPSRVEELRQAPAPVKEEKSLPPKPRFDFYTILPEMEVVVPDPVEEAPPAKAPVVEGRPAMVKEPDTPPSVATAPATAYILQMGSFRRHEDADRLKASLALIGIEAEIQRVNVNNGDIYFRVRSGPYRNPKQINELRSRLQQNKINSLLIKLK